MPKYCPSSLSPALVQNEWKREPSVLVGSVFIGEKRVGCLSYKSYSTVSTGQRRSHCPETNVSHYSVGLQGAATTGQLPCRQSIPGEYSSFIRSVQFLAVTSADNKGSCPSSQDLALCSCTYGTWFGIVDTSISWGDSTRVFPPSSRDSHP